MSYRCFVLFIAVLVFWPVLCLAQAEEEAEAEEESPAKTEEEVAPPPLLPRPSTAPT